MTTPVLVLGGIALAGVIMAMWRFLFIRSVGTAVVIRRLPARGEHGWRYGRVRYTGSRLVFYQLRSLSPLADLKLPRRSSEILTHRDLSDREQRLMPRGARIVEFRADGRRFEMACNSRGETALTSWIESAPNARDTDAMTRTVMWRRASRRR